MSTDGATKSPSPGSTPSSQRRDSGEFDNAIVTPDGSISLATAHNKQPAGKKLSGGVLKGLFAHTVEAGEVSGLILIAFGKLGFDVTKFSGEQMVSLLRQTTAAMGKLAKITVTDIEAGVAAVVYTHSIHSIFEQQSKDAASGAAGASAPTHKLFDKISGHTGKKVSASEVVTTTCRELKIDNPATVLAAQVIRDNPDNAHTKYGADAHKAMVKATVHKGFMDYLGQFFTTFAEVGAVAATAVAVSAATAGAADLAGAAVSAAVIAGSSAATHPTPAGAPSSPIADLISGAASEVATLASTLTATTQGALQAGANKASAAAAQAMVTVANGVATAKASAQGALQSAANEGAAALSTLKDGAATAAASAQALAGQVQATVQGSVSAATATAESLAASALAAKQAAALAALAAIEAEHGPYGKVDHVSCTGEGGDALE